MRHGIRFSLLMLLIISLPVFGSEEVFSLSNFDSVEVNAKKIAKEKLGFSIEGMVVERIGVSEWFLVATGKDQYVIDKDAKYWLKGGIDDFYVVEDGVNQVNFSNESHELLMDMIGFISNSLEYFVVINPSVSKPLKRVYVFIDLTCPHCREFHLSERANWELDGIQWVYIPFLRDVNDIIANKLAQFAFCGKTNKERISRINDIYLMDEKQKSKVTPISGECDLVSKLILDYSLRTGYDYSLRGSPLFVTESGKTYYGVPALRLNELQKKTDMHTF